MERFHGRDFVLFTELFDVAEGCAGVVVSFLAILELFKAAILGLVQAEPYARSTRGCVVPSPARWTPDHPGTMLDGSGRPPCPPERGLGSLRAGIDGGGRPQGAARTGVRSSVSTAVGPGGWRPPRRDHRGRAMLQLREEQYQSLEDAARSRFKGEMLAHLSAFSPPLAKTLGDEGLLRVIDLGLDRSAGYGFTLRGPVRLYLELMLLFGSHFDTDPQYPWCRRILSDPFGGTETTKADHLYREVVIYRQAVAGPNDRFTIAALRDLDSLCAAPLAVRSDQFEADLHALIAAVYPQKASFIGDDGLGRLIDLGVDSARRMDFTSTRARALFVILMFAFGHGCLDDPLYPWIHRTVQDPRIVDSAARAKRLETKARTWLGQVLDHLDPGRTA